MFSESPASGKGLVSESSGATVPASDEKSSRRPHWGLRKYECFSIPHRHAKCSRDWEFHRIWRGWREVARFARVASVRRRASVGGWRGVGCRSIRSVGCLASRGAIAGAFASVAVQLAFTYAPLMNKLFHTAPIDLGAWLRVAGVSAASFLIVELEKQVRARRRRSLS
jgi:hypothetical protein